MTVFCLLMKSVYYFAWIMLCLVCFFCPQIINGRQSCSSMLNIELNKGLGFCRFSVLNLIQQRTQDREAQWRWSGLGAAVWMHQAQTHCRSWVLLLCGQGVCQLCGSEPEEFGFCEDYCAKKRSRTECRLISRRDYCDQNSNLCLNLFS